MTPTTFFRSRTIVLYFLGTALALEHMLVLFPDGLAASAYLQLTVFYVLPLFFITGLALTLIDHILATPAQIWASVQDGVIALVVPTAIVLLLPSLYLEVWRGSFFVENQILVSLRLLSYMTLYAASILFVTAFLGRVAGRLFFRL